MNIHGAFVVCGGADAPSLHFLSPAEQAAHYERDRLAWTPNGKRQALRLTFGVDALYALPAWSADCMTFMATRYTGDDADAVRGMCAALALGRSLIRPDVADVPATSKPAAMTGGPSGGRTVRPVKPAPTAPASPGGFFAGVGR